MASKFSDINKSPNDLLGDDFTTKTSLKCKKNAGPIAVTIETERAVDSGALSSKIGTKFSYDKFNVDKAQATANGGRVLETSMKVAPGLKLSFKSNKGADAGFDYVSGNLYTTGKIDAVEMSKLATSACLKLRSGVKVGGEATYALKGTAGLTGLNIGANYVSGPLFTSIKSADKFSKAELGLTYQATDLLTVASITTHSSSNPVELVGVGASYKAAFGVVKAKYGLGNFSACVVKEIAPKVTLTASGTVPVSDFSKFKYGVGIAM